MKILQVHNAYVNPGGEDVVLDLEADLLRRHGHEVRRLTASNREIEEQAIGRGRLALDAVWSGGFRRRFRDAVYGQHPHVVHVHNTFVRISPAVFWECSRLELPVVLTLHNYRTVCANALLLRDGSACEACVGRVPLPALRYRCYRGSLSATGAVVAMQVAHRALGTFRHKIDAFIALTAFAKSVISRGGIPADRIHVKPNFVPDPAADLDPSSSRDPQVSFLGRMVPEKGVDLLLEAWSRVRPEGWRLSLIGDGPERKDLQERFADLPGVVWRGWVERRAALDELRRSRFLVMPSRWYEGFPMVLLESFALGTPAIVPGHAAFPEIVEDAATGTFFAPNDAASLADALSRATALPTPDWSSWSGRCRESYLARYTADVNYRELIAVYEQARARAGEAR